MAPHGRVKALQFNPSQFKEQLIFRHLAELGAELSRSSGSKHEAYVTPLLGL